MKSISLPFAVIALLILSGCSGSGDKVYQTARLHDGLVQEIFLDNIPSDTLVLEASDIFSNFVAIPLQTKEECLIQNIRLTLSDKDLFVGTQNFPNPARLYRFDRKGRFLNEIGRGGKGPGEHSGYDQTFCHYYSQNNTVLVDWIGDDPQLFSVDGTLLKTLKMPFWNAMDMYRWDEKEWFATGTAGGIPHSPIDSFLLYFFTDDGKITQSISRTRYPPEKTNNYVPITWGNSVFRFNGKWKVYFPGIDTVFTIQDKELVPACILHPGTKVQKYNEPISPQSLKGKFNLFISNENAKNLYLQKSVITKAEVHQFKPGRWSGAFHTQEMMIIIDKKSGNGAISKIHDDLYGVIPERMFQDLSWHPNGEVSLYIPVPDLQEMIRDYKSTHENIPAEIASRLKPLEALHEDDNPVIFLFKLKDYIKIK